MQKKLNIVSLVLLGFFTILMIKLTLPYLSFEDDVAFLRIKQWIIHNKFWKAAFFIHVITSCFCLIAGFTQFSNKILSKRPKIHHYLGWLYIVIVLCFSAPSGLIMGVYANGGITSQVAFITLSILWIVTTYNALDTVRKRDFQAHQRFMIRSYALTLSAISLRLWKLLIVSAFRPHPMDAYMVVAWLGWVPNMLIAELYIRKKLSIKFSKNIKPKHS